MYEMGRPRGCVVVLYPGCGVEFGFVASDEGGGVWYVFGGNMSMVCKSALLRILDLVLYLSWVFFDVEYACVGAILHFWEVCVVVIFWASTLAFFAMLAMMSSQFCIFSGSKVVVGGVMLWVFFEFFEFMLWMCQLGVFGV